MELALIALSRVKGLYETQSLVSNASMFSGNILDTELMNFGFLKHTRGHFNSQQ